VSVPVLLDANLLIALVVEEHEHHERAVAFVSSTDRVATCPVVEGALVRFLVRLGELPATAVAVLAALHRSPRCELWPDDLGFQDVDLGHVTGHRQVTDAYLAALAAHHGGRLATFDRALALALPDSVELVP
jgi:toxin-antitoxin system PIN domain toxin